MRSWIVGMFTLGAAVALARPAGAAEELSLRRVLLSSGGVGYFEYEAKVDGNATVPLEVRLDQVDDVLKSIVVFDDAGRAGTITLPSRSPDGDVLRDTPFDAQALTSEPALLEALRGAEVRITVMNETIAGRILSVTDEEVAVQGGGTVTRHRLAVLSAGGVRSMLLEDAQNIVFTDEHLQAQLDAALAASLEAKQQGQRTLLVHAEGQGSRVLRVAYVAAVPLWKSTYRLVLPVDPADKKADVQGWAVIENQSGHPFAGVDLTLISGSPVTFHQALYDTYYVNRPEIPVEVVGRVLPRLDEGAVSVEGRTAGARRRAPHDGAPTPPMPSAAFAPNMAGANANAPAAAPSLAPTTSAEGTESMTQVLFHVAEPVTLASGQTALVPILDRRMTAERVSLYQPETATTNPLAAIHLVNETDTGLPPGVVTVYDRSGPGGASTYAGDARLSTLPAGDDRMLAYGVDTKVRVDRRDQPHSLVTSVKIANGVLTITRSDLQTAVYTIKGAAREPRTVIIEHPRMMGYEIQDHIENLVSMDESHYRLRVEVPAGKTVPLTITLARPLGESVSIADLNAQALLAYASSSELSPAARDALRRLATLRGAVDDKAAAVADRQAEVGRITAEQNRIRENLKVVPAGSSLQMRYLAELGAQEDRLRDLDRELDAARTALDQAKRALADAVRSTSI